MDASSSSGIVRKLAFFSLQENKLREFGTQALWPTGESTFSGLEE